MERHDWLAQRSQAEKEALYRAELENYSEKMVLDGEQRVVFINQKYAAEFGCSPDEIEGRFFEEIVPPEDAPVLLDLKDFSTPYIPNTYSVGDSSYIPIFLRAPLTGEQGEYLGDMIYDGRDWLQRYRTLYNKMSELMDEYEYLHPTKPRSERASFVGNSPPTLALKREILQVAKSNATLLIEGETGSGKEVVADEVFRASDRKYKKFIKLNCAALPQELIESELFGYEDGAFTGARKGGKRGLFEAASGGVILLDEINSLNLPAQAKLLRVLQERVVTRIGGETAIPFDVRIIAISNCSLEDMVAAGTFREDLYYRLNVLQISVPPLRKRIEDIPELVYLFVARCNEEMGKQVKKVDPQIFDHLKSCPWPGNVRQLQNWVERAMATVWKGILTISNFYWIDRDVIVPDDNIMLMAPSGRSLPEMMAQIQCRIIEQTLHRTHGNKKKAAEELGISRQMLHRKIRQFNLESADSSP